MQTSIFMKEIDWAKEVQPLIKKYKGKPHPLTYKNTYQLLVMVVLSAQDSDKNINKVTIPFFEAFPDMKSLAKADQEMLFK